MPSLKTVLLVGFAAVMASAYMNNCQGSPSPPNPSPNPPPAGSLAPDPLPPNPPPTNPQTPNPSTPNRADCDAAVRNINRNQQYQDQAQFSSGNCNIIYSTDGAGAQTVRGSTIFDTANTILNQCSNLQGNYGTGNCDSCHVRITYRNLSEGDFSS